MFPISDDDSDLVIVPFVNYVLLAINIFVFVILQGLGSNESFTGAFVLIPNEIITGVDLVGPQSIEFPDQTVTIMEYAAGLGVYFNILSSMFMHGDISHIFGNMLFLWIFGDNIENLLGHVRYIFFYLACGIAAAGAQVLSEPYSIIPMLGASGAISGVLGAYILMFPKRRVRALIFNLFTTVPAYVALGFWIGYQVVMGLFSSEGAGGVAYMAHIGGFVGGLLLIKLFAIGKSPRVFVPRNLRRG